MHACSHISFEGIVWSTTDEGPTVQGSEQTAVQLGLTWDTAR
jgi:hypothetical protein